MGSVETEILNDIVSALRNSGAFALVELGGSGSETTVPRATVVYETRETFASDGFPTSRWVRLKARVFIRTRSESPAEGVTRTVDLCGTAADAILQDPYRAQRCHDLPIGRATEVQLTHHARSDRYPERKTSLDVRAPHREMSLTVRCHYELPDSGNYPTTSTLDGEGIFSWNRRYISNRRRDNGLWLRNLSANLTRVWKSWSRYANDAGSFFRVA